MHQRFVTAEDQLAETAAEHFIGTAAEEVLERGVDVGHRPRRVHGVEDGHGETASAEGRTGHRGGAEQPREGRRAFAPAAFYEAHAPLLPRYAVADKCQPAATFATGRSRGTADSE